jgi:hypothetical protein
MQLGQEMGALRCLKIITARRGTAPRAPPGSAHEVVVFAIAGNFALGYNLAMVYHGRVKGGVIVPDPPADLPEGAQVNIELVTAKDTSQVADPTTKAATPFAGLLSLAGQAQDLPADAARNYEHYLYGTDKEKRAERP